MEDFKNISPLLDKWTIGDRLETDGIAEVYLVSSEGGSLGNLALLKHYSYPRTKEQLDALYFSGSVTNESEAREYLARSVKEQAYELAYIQSLKESPYVFTDLEFQITEKKDSVGFDIYVLMDYREMLEKYLKYNAMTHLRAVNLGIDICSGLEDLREKGLIHTNIKPSNIYISTYGQYMLGDFGFRETKSMTGSYVPEHYISDYSAPELSGLMGEPNETVDTYSLGLILYRIFNANHAPFEDENTSAAAARKKRESGEALPHPLYADYELGTIILKACAFDPKDRYQTPTEFKQALKEYYLRNTVTDELIVPPINSTEDEDWNPDLEEKPEPVQNVVVDDLDEDFKKNFTPAAPVVAPDDDKKNKPKKSNKGFWIGMLIVCAVICISGFFAMKYWPTVEIYSIDTEVAGSDVIIVSWSSGGYANENWKLVCADAYGNRIENNVTGTSYVLSGLTPGTQYTITLEPYQGYIRTEGITNVSVATVSHTSISEFTAVAASSTEIDLSWTVNGTAPDTWNVSYTVGDKEVTKQVQGTSTKIDGLISGDFYTFTLSTNYETLVSGTSVVSCQAPWHTDISNLKAESVLPSAVEVSWDIAGQRPEVWQLTCTASDGSFVTTNVVGESWTVENLQPDTEYTFDILPSGNYETSGETSVSCKTTKCEIVSIDTQSETPFNAIVTWTVDGVSPAEWTIEYGIDGEESLSELISGSSITMSALYPQSTYTVKISAPAEYCLMGSTEATFTTADAEPFTDYGCKDVSISLYKTSDTELENPVQEFSIGDAISIVITASYDETEEDKTVNAAYFIRNEEGRVVGYTQDVRTWSGTWTELDHTDTIDILPEQAGTYTLEVYFDGKILATKKFSID